MEANIGAGKSTLLAALQLADPELVVLHEPVQLWTASDDALPHGGGMLQAFYAEPVRHAATFQSFALQTRLTQLLDAAASEQARDAVAVSERSVPSSMGIFGTMIRPRSGPEWVAYRGWADFAARAAAPHPVAGIVYLRTSPEVCSARISKRGREAEGGVPLAYLERLHQQHEDWVAAQECPVLCLDGDLAVSHVPAVSDFIRSVRSGRV